MSTRKHKKLRILIFYAEVGGGHESLAEGLKERLEELFPHQTSIRLIDPLTSIARPAYQLSVLVSPKFYDLFYRLSQRTLTKRLISRINYFVHEEKIKHILEAHQPDLILSTHFFFSSEVKEVILKNGLQIPVVVYIADPLSPHPAWFSSKTDLNLTFDRSYLPDLTPYGIADSRVIAIGIPVQKSFYATYNREKIRKKLGLDPYKFTILFGGSGLGMDHLERLAKPVCDLDGDFQCIFLCGKNTILFKTLKLLLHDRKNMKCFRYLHNEEVAQIMQSADLFVGKAGPNVMFECIFSNLPQIVTPPMLNQERGNREFIKKNSLGLLSVNTQQTVGYLKKFLSHPTTLTTYRKKSEDMRKKLIKIEQKGLKEFAEWIKNQAVLDPKRNGTGPDTRKQQVHSPQ